MSIGYQMVKLLLRYGYEAYLSLGASSDDTSTLGASSTSCDFGMKLSVANSGSGTWL